MGNRNLTPPRRQGGVGSAFAHTNGSGVQRYTSGRACPICGGAEGDRRGQGSRCAGYISSDETHAYCTREEHAGSLSPKAGTSPLAYPHKVKGNCGCGRTHGYTPDVAPKARKGPWLPPGELIGSFIYHDAGGRESLKADRYATSDGKTFRQLTPSKFNADGTAARWLSGTGGWSPVPYRLPKLLSLPRGSTVYIAEGERKVEALELAGLVATCNVGGAGKWRDEFGPHLDGQQVIILPDNDDAGKAHSQAVARSVYPHAASVKVVELPDLPPKGDIIDWIESGRTVAEMVAITAAAPTWQPPADPPPLRVISPGADTPSGFPLTDLGNGERMASMFGDRIRYCHVWSKWLVWDGRRWAVDNTAAVSKLAKKTVRSIYAEAALEERKREREAIAEWAKSSESKGRIEAMLWAAAREDGVPVLPEELDRHPWLLNCRNGTIDLQTGKLRPHNKVDLLTKIAPVDFDPNGEHPLFSDTLRTFLVTDELINFWQRLCGMAMTGVVEDHVLPIAYGTGSNGKSTLLNVLIDALGLDYAMKAAPDLLIAKRGEAHPTDRADLFGKRLVVAIETDDGQRLNESMVKELTGGDRIRARRMREDFWEFEPTHTVILATNHKPQVRGTDHGIWRRLKLVPFAVQMPDDQAKKNVPRLLKKELPGILAWMVRGCLAWQADGLNPPAEVKDATRQYREDEDVLGVFLDEHTTRHPALKVRSGDLYARYKAWSEASGLGTFSVVKFGKSIEERGFRKEKSSFIHYMGLGLRQDDQWSGRGDSEPPAGGLGELGANSTLNEPCMRDGELSGNSLPTLPTLPGRKGGKRAYGYPPPWPGANDDDAESSTPPTVPGEIEL